MKIDMTVNTREVDQAISLIKMANVKIPDLSTDQKIEIVNKAMNGEVMLTKTNGLHLTIGVESFFMEYILKKIKPFIGTIMTIIELVKDANEDIKILAGETTTKVNGNIIGSNKNIKDVIDESSNEEDDEEE